MASVAASLLPKNFMLEKDDDNNAFDRALETLSDEELDEVINGLKMLGATEVTEQ